MIYSQKHVAMCKRLHRLHVSAYTNPRIVSQMGLILVPHTNSLMTGTVFVDV